LDNLFKWNKVKEKLKGSVRDNPAFHLPLKSYTGLIRRQ
jgi:hypothetical protein